MGRYKDLTGQQFGRLTALEPVKPDDKCKQYKWICRCECGGRAKVRSGDLTSGHTLSCGCLKRLHVAMPRNDIRLYRIWSTMKARCTNPKAPSYKYYGARGIELATSWLHFENFYNWAMANGYEDGLSIERIDNYKGYGPDNCTWIPLNRQGENKRATKKVTYCGREFTLANLCRIYGVNYNTVAQRLKRGILIADALVHTGRIKMNTKLLELSDRLKDLRTKKSDLEKEVRETNAEIDGITTEMIDIMTTEELNSFNRNGTNFSLVVQEFPSPEPERKGELWEVMKKQGFEDLFTINSQTLSATVKELIASNNGLLPEWLDGLIKIAEKNSIRVSKAKKY